jgi:hypothetical protein
MGEGRISSFTQPVEHEAELKLQGELHRTTALTGQSMSFLTRYPEAVFLARPLC